MALFLYSVAFVGAMVGGIASVDGFGWTLLKAAIPWGFVLTMVPVMVWVERKGSAYIQDRTGPERAFIPGVGLRLAGLVHTVSDVLKLATKETVLPRHINKFIFVLAPGLSIFIALILGAVIPFAHPIELEGFTLSLQALDINIGILWVLAASSVGVYAVMLAAWSSNNKYSQLGGLRSGASMISYELTLGLAIAGLFLVFNTPRLLDIVEAQSGAWLGFLPRWGVFVQPLGFLLFFISALAETNRTPFDLAEAESELVAGFHTEYGGIRFALFFMAEYVAIVVQCLLIATLFFGGYQLLPWMDTHAFLSQPGNATLVLIILLVVTLIGGALTGWKLLDWHKTNRERWQDARRKEGAVLAFLFGFIPAGLAALALLIWGGTTLGSTGAAVTAAVVEAATLVVKTLFFCWVFVWIRWTVPRFRYDQLMSLGWKVLVPLGIANLIITAILVQLGVF